MTIICKRKHGPSWLQSLHNLSINPPTPIRNPYTDSDSLKTHQNKEFWLYF